MKYLYHNKLIALQPAKMQPEETIFSYHKHFDVKYFCSRHLSVCLRKLLPITLYLLFLWHAHLRAPHFSCYAKDVKDSTRLIDKISGSDIERNGAKRNLTNHDRRSIINRLQSNLTLKEIKYVISRNGTPYEVCILSENKIFKGPRVQNEGNCDIVKRRSCGREFVLGNRVRTIHNCEAEGLSETCVTNKRRQIVLVEAMLCQNRGKLVCNEKTPNNISYHEGEKICHSNRLAMCQKRPKLITVTETQKLCGKDFQAMSYRTTKFCITYEHETDPTLIGDWRCLDLEHLFQRCLPIHFKKQIRSEITSDEKHSKLECTYKGIKN